MLGPGGLCENSLVYLHCPKSSCSHNNSTSGRCSSEALLRQTFHNLMHHMLSQILKLIECDRHKCNLYGSGIVCSSVQQKNNFQGYVFVSVFKKIFCLTDRETAELGLVSPARLRESR